MKPILYASVTEGTVPVSFGIGTLNDCIRAEVPEDLNGKFEMSFEYAADGIHADQIVPNAIIKAKPNYTDDPQLFRIYKVGKTINGKFTVNAQHISYDLSGKVIATGSAASCVNACLLLTGSAGNFTINTDKTVSASFEVSEPSSVRSWFGGKQGSLLDVYGGEWKYDNYTASLKQARGTDRGVTIRYGKNLVDLSQELSIENLVTGVIPYYIDGQTNAKTVGALVPTGLVLDVDRNIAVNFSQDVDPESATSISDQLAALAADYIAKNNLTNAVNSITLDFVQLQGLTERVDLGDTVHIYFEALGISAALKCVSVVWDVLEERYSKVTFGSVQANIAQTIAVQQKEVAEKPSTSFLYEAAKRASELITGNLGGYVVIHDSNGDGEPDEILIMDTADISTAVKVWRWNQNGLGYSGNGYAGPYNTLALTADGQIVATAITTGTLNADLIKAGTIEDAAGNSTIDMTNGAATLYSLRAKRDLTIIGTDGLTKGFFSQSGNDQALIELDNSATNTPTVQIYGLSDGGNVVIRNAAGTSVGALFAQNGRGYFYQKNDQNVQTVNIQADQDGGLINLRDNSGDLALQIAVSSGGGGTFFCNDANGNKTIQGIGETGDLICVVLTQTSSRKVKENIKPIEDARKILELQAVSFDYKNKNLGTNKRGFIAEDVAEVLPNLVKAETEDTPATLNYIEMIPYLQEIIKEQDARIKKLEELINGTD
ncbi:MAG: phage tail protein [Clostridia bacterium]|nr:phage tail protein [Clostridia bacterium]